MGLALLAKPAGVMQAEGPVRATAGELGQKTDKSKYYEGQAPGAIQKVQGRRAVSVKSLGKTRPRTERDACRS